MFRSLCFASLLCASSAFANGPIRVGIVDTGLDLSDPRFSKSLCKYGHRDFTGMGIEDKIGHGTHIASIIQRNLAGLEGQYCFVIINYYDSSSNNTDAYVRAIQYATNLGLDFVNASASGDFPAYTRNRKNSELKVYQSAKRTTFIVAAGNEGHDLDRECDQYPVCYSRQLDNVISVGSTESNGVKAPLSNYGRAVETWEVGVNVEGYKPKGGTIRYSGTSQATAAHTGKVVRNRILNGR